jgi:hypothetical protein
MIVGSTYNLVGFLSAAELSRGPGGVRGALAVRAVR